MTDKLGTRLLTMALFCSLAAQANAAPPPVESYGRLPAIGDAALSPDGTRLVLEISSEFKASEPDRDLTAVRIVNVDTGTIEHTLGAPPKHKLRGVGWADDRRPYYFISTTADVKDAFPSAMPLAFRGGRIEFWRTS